MSTTPYRVVTELTRTSASEKVYAMTSAVRSDSWDELSMPLDRLLGKASAKQLASMGLHTAYDALYHFPFRLAHRGELMPIAAAGEGEAVTVVARVLRTNLRPMNSRRGHILNVDISDGSHELALTFFSRNPRPLHWHASRLSVGTVAIFSGTVSSYRGKLQLAHPEYELIDDEENMEEDITKATRPIPIYHATAKMPSWKIAKAIATVLSSVSDIPELLPEGYLQEHNLPGRFSAIHTLHAPENDEEWRRATRRLAHEEAFVLQAVLAQRSWETDKLEARACPPHSGGIAEVFDAQLPYTLTEGQKQVGKEISADLSQTRPMRRLLQGDVGSGKTIVALRAMLQAVDSGGQAVLLAPTEVLARQHCDTIEQLLGPLGMAGMIGGADNATRVELLTGSLSAAERKKALMRIASGEAGIIIGTHALLYEKSVAIPQLALVVVDEQHRFGVDQRSALGSQAHTLVMTATPIPRTVAMSVFGDLEVSVLRELPAGRKKVSTTIVPYTKTVWVERAWQRAREEVENDGRVYVVCPRIGDDGDDAAFEENFMASESELSQDEGSEKRPLASVLATAQQLANNPVLDGIDIGIMHGRLPAEEKRGAMSDFASGQTPILVSTTVIEVGVDVPEATMMIIMDADRFGLSQLHQLRGRIGRGGREGLCLALTDAPEGSLAARRLAAFASTTDGFLLAEEDLQLRGEGDILGASQSGRRSHIRFLSIIKDADIISAAREGARALIARDPEITSLPELANEISRMDEGQADYLEKS